MSHSLPQPGSYDNDEPKQDVSPKDTSSLVDIAILNLGPVYEEGVRHFLALDPARKQWSAEKCSRIRIRTECRWGRVQPNGEDIYMLNEKGDGPREPLSDSVRACVSLYAELDGDGKGDPGFTEDKPFCKVAIDRNTAAQLQASGWIALEAFLDQRIPELQEAYEMWRDVLVKARSKAATKTQTAQKNRTRARQS